MVAKEAVAAGAVSRVGRYQLAYELASGGMATVYLARADGAAGFDKIVALKRIHPHLAKESAFIEMFLDEARIASRISHPNVCSVFDFGEAGGSYYIAMEYVMGETVGRLVRRLRQNPSTYKDPRLPAFAARIIAGACDGLHAAHELTDDHGELLHVVHRDVSPQNLFVAFDGTVRVVDFGIARAAGRLHETRTGTVKGKLAYMPPEQARKQPLDRRADVWALGVVLWEILCAKRLFKRENDVETILAVVSDEIPSPSKVRETVPPELDAIVMKALSREPDERYATAREMGRELQRFLARSEEPVTNADVGDWISDLFAEEKEQRQNLVRSARTVTSGQLPMPAGLVVEDLSESEVRPLISDTDVTGTDNANVGPLPPVAPAPVVTGATDSERPTARHDAAKPADAPAAKVPVKPPPPPPPPREDYALPSTKFRREHVLYLVGAVVILGALVFVFSLGGDDGAERASTEVPPTAGNASPITSAGPEGLDVETETGPAVETVEQAQTEEDREQPHEEIQVAAPEEETADDTREAEEPTADIAMGRPGVSMSRSMTRASTAQDSRPGQINIATPGGWADVFLEGRRLGRAPGRVTAPSGRQVLDIRPFGGRESRRVPVNVPSGGSTRIVVQLSR